MSLRDLVRTSRQEQNMTELIFKTATAMLIGFIIGAVMTYITWIAYETITYLLGF